MKTAVTYSRVSTDEQAKNGYSLQYQEEVLEKYCTAQGIQVLRHFQDDHSAKTFNRPKFNQLLEYLKTHKRSVDYVLFLKWDRFSRNATDSFNMIRQLTEWGIEPQAVQQPLDLSIPQNKLMLAFYLMEPEVNNDVRSLATKEGLRKLKLLGGWVVQPPMGYQAKRTETGLPTMEPNKLAPLIREAFQLIADGTSQKEVREMMRKKGRPVNKNHFLVLLKHRCYIGQIFVDEHKNEPAKWVKGLHEPLVSEELFNMVQRRLATNGSAKGKHLKLSEDLPLRGHLLCNRCGNKLTGSASRGRLGGKYYYYHCQYGCKERFPSQEVNEAFESHLRRLKPKPEIVELYKAILEDIFSEKAGSGEDRIKEVKKEVSELREKLLRADELFVDGKLPADRYTEFTDTFRRKLHQHEQELEELQAIDTDYKVYIDQGFLLVNHIDSYFQFATLEAKSKLVGSIYPHQMIYVGNGQYRTPSPNQVIALFTSVEADFEVMENKKAAFYSSFCEMGSGDRTRTCDLRVMSPTSYHLLYPALYFVAAWWAA
jgi:site-specific DNA recombinase